MDAITYSLKINESNSEKYYTDAGVLADEVLLKAETSLMPIIFEYTDYIKKYNLETLREKEEYLLELMSFGILWRTYAKTALAVRFAPFILLAKMGEWRKKHQRIKPLIDLSRGIFISVFLLPDVRKKNISINPTLRKIDRVGMWFEATGEFREQALRFILWRAFWGSLSIERQSEIFSSIDDFVIWFEHRSEDALGKYTMNVNKFILNSGGKYKWREDQISCLRTRFEYHLNMVGACLMNRAFRNEFISTEITAVLLPGCMRIKNNNNCKAARESKGLKCTGCEPECRVNLLRAAGLKKDFEVYVIPHASDLSLWSSKGGQLKRGVVASACVTHLVEGGWELKRYGVPAQCVLLDYSGCKKHWHPVGIQTEINKHELDRIISRQRN